MQVTRLHGWDLKPAEAIGLQKRLAAQVVSDRPIELAQVRLVAGVDVSVKGDRSRAAVVVLTFPELEVVETVTAEGLTPFPYIPGLLSFREGPTLVEAFEKLQSEPDALIFDGMGRAHPRRIGIASHMGLWLGRPTVGCGKTHLIGDHDEPGPMKGSTSPLVDRGEVIGAVVRTRDGVKPVYVSPGNLADLESAVALTLACTTRYRLPEPIRWAHRAAGAF